MPAIAYNDTDVIDQPWDGGANEARIKTPVTAQGSKLWAWYEGGSGLPDTKGAYKMPHHEVNSDGVPGAANVNGVRAALSRLGQANTQIPSGDVAAVRSHLQKHLDKFNAKNKGEAPERVLGVMDLAAGSVALQVETVGKVWAIRRHFMAVLSDLHGQTFVVDAARMSARPGQVDNRGGVAVVPLHGVITPSASIIDMLFGGSGGLTQFMGDMRAALADGDVNAVVMDVDSPGGTVDLVPEAAAQIRQMREQSDKPIVAVANTVAASAAYWLASQAHELIVTPSGEVGSIGVFQHHIEGSKMFDQMGIKHTLISAGEHKTDGNPFEPLSSAAAADIQQAVDDYHSLFTADVAAGRGVDQQAVADGYGQGKMFTAQRARRAGLVDRVATLGETVQRLGSGRAKVKRTSAQAEQDDFFRDRVRIVDERELVGNGAAALTPEERHRLLNVLAQTW